MARTKHKQEQQQAHKGCLYFLRPTPYALRPHQGFTLVELLIVLAILGAIGVAFTRFQADIFLLYGTTRDSLSVQQDVRRFLKVAVAEIRSAQGSDLGAYPIEAAATSSLVFFRDIDANGTRERIRYFIDGTTLRRGVTHASGVPLQYNLAEEKLTDQVQNLVATTTPIFTYYTAGHVPTMTALPLPVDVGLIRLVKIQVAADVNPVRAPGVITGSSAVSIRNLKDRK